MRWVTPLVDIFLAVYIGVTVVRFIPQYRGLKLAIAKGDAGARLRLYRRALGFEWSSALLALLALGFDPSRLNPALLDLKEIPSLQSGNARSALSGLLVGMAAATVGLIVARIRANRRGEAGGSPARAPRLRKLMPDYSALVPVTARERLLWLLVAVSAGICEEIVFRGWLLSTLHGPLELNGAVLIVTAAAIFGLAHGYQRAMGVLLTALAGALFCALYVASGSLLVPIVLHALIDARFALLPAPRHSDPRPAASVASG